MARGTPHPFKVGTAERVLYDRWKKANDQASTKEKEANLLFVEAQGLRATAESYANALRALGAGDKVPGQAQIPDLRTSDQKGM